MAANDKFEVGDRTFYRQHGLATIVEIEEKSVGDQTLEFYVLDMVQGGRAMLPTTQASRDVLRPLVTRETAEALMAKVKTPPSDDDGLDRKQRVQVAEEMVKEGAPEGYMEAIQRLLHQREDKALNATELRVLDTALGYFVEEFSVVLEVEPAQLRDDLLGTG